MDDDTDILNTSDISKSQSGGSIEQKAAKVIYKPASDIVSVNDLFTAASKYYHLLDMK